MLALALLAASVASAAPDCQPNPEVEKQYVLWLNAPAIPDEAPCAARLRYASCTPWVERSGPTGETRHYRSNDGKSVMNVTYFKDGSIVAVVIADDYYVNFGNITWRRAVVQGWGADGVTGYNPDTGRRKDFGGVHVIPAANLTPAAEAKCPADK